MNTQKFIYLDLGFFSNCNLRCKYCRNEIVNNNYYSDLEASTQQILEFKKNFSALVAKVSGYGEITLYPHFQEYLKLLSESFPSVQIITNGTYNDEIADLLDLYSNVSINITLDGHKLEMNSLRVGNSGIRHNKIIDNIEKLCKKGKPLEINTVLHDRNLDHIVEFASYLDSMQNESLMWFPFPVRSFDRSVGANKRYNTQMKEFIPFLKIIKDKYPLILPPLKYIDNLISFIDTGYRTSKCKVHYFNIGTGSLDELLACPNYGEEYKYGSFTSLLQKPEKILEIKSNQKNKNKIGDNCAQCFNHYDVINDLLGGDISVNEFFRIPSIKLSNKMEFIKKILEKVNDYGVSEVEVYN